MFEYDLSVFESVISLVLSGALGYFNMKIMQLLGYFHERNKEEIVLISIFLSIVNLFIFFGVLKAFDCFKISHFFFNNYIIKLLITIGLSYVVTLYCCPWAIENIYVRVNKLRGKKGKTKITPESVDEIFYKYVKSKSIYIYTLDDKLVTRGNVIYAPFEKEDKLQLLIQPFDGEAYNYSFEELIQCLEQGTYQGNYFISIEDNIKAVIIE